MTVSIGDRLRLTASQTYLKTADPMPMLRPPVPTPRGKPTLKGSPPPRERDEALSLPMLRAHSHRLPAPPKPLLRRCLSLEVKPMS